MKPKKSELIPLAVILVKWEVGRQRATVGHFQVAATWEAARRIYIAGQVFEKGLQNIAS